VLTNGKLLYARTFPNGDEALRWGEEEGHGQNLASAPRGTQPRCCDEGTTIPDFVQTDHVVDSRGDSREKAITRKEGVESASR
jgi:hypothetical protein